MKVIGTILAGMFFAVIGFMGLTYVGALITAWF